MNETAWEWRGNSTYSPALTFSGSFLVYQIIILDVFVYVCENHTILSGKSNQKGRKNVFWCYEYNTTTWQIDFRYFYIDYNSRYFCKNNSSDLVLEASMMTFLFFTWCKVRRETERNRFWYGVINFLCYSFFPPLYVRINEGTFSVQEHYCFFTHQFWVEWLDLI